MKTSKELRIIGITGPFGSGKTTASSFFEKKGYQSISLSSFLEEEALKRGLELTRHNLQDIGNEMRSKYGAGILMDRALKKFNATKIVVDGIRNIGELEVLRKDNGAVVVAIVADRKVRFERLRSLKRREKLTEDLFEKLDLRDLGVNEKITGLQTAFCIALSDAYIDSNGSMANFEEKLENFLNEYGG